jgi:hypothetical protein
MAKIKSKIVVPAKNKRDLFKIKPIEILDKSKLKKKKQKKRIKQKNAKMARFLSAIQQTENTFYNHGIHDPNNQPRWIEPPKNLPPIKNLNLTFQTRDTSPCKEEVPAIESLKRPTQIFYVNPHRLGQLQIEHTKSTIFKGSDFVDNIDPVKLQEMEITVDLTTVKNRPLADRLQDEDMKLFNFVQNVHKARCSITRTNSVNPEKFHHFINFPNKNYVAIISQINRAKLF